MELQLNRDSICINEIVFDGTLEQSIELDYLLPDYCQSIFKVLKCRITPKITSSRVQNGKLFLDGVACIKVIYVSEENYRICAITQKQAFSKTVDLKDGYEEGIVNASVKCDYVNCRVVNQRRLDLRGALSIRASVSATRQIEVLSGATGMGVQVRSRDIAALDKKLHANKDFTIREELELSYGKPQIAEILDEAANTVLSEYKLIANKIILKGEILLHILYACEDPLAGPEIMDFTIPVSQIVDLPGINEEYQCNIVFDVTSIDLTPRQNSEGECRCIDAEFCIRVSCEADKNAAAQLIGDAYSTGYELQTEASTVKIEQLICVVNESCVCSERISIPQGEVSRVYDIGCSFSGETCRFEENGILVSGTLELCVLALDHDNIPVFLEKNAPCEIKIPSCCEGEGQIFSPHITITGVSYSLLSGEEIEVKAELKICGNLYEYRFYPVINSIQVDENSRKKRPDNAALRLYFAERGECVWEIAKRYNTPVDAIMLENNLDSDTLPAKMMLFIPIIEG